MSPARRWWVMAAALAALAVVAAAAVSVQRRHAQEEGERRAARAPLQVAAGELAKAQLEQTQSMLDAAIVRSPIAGVVAKRHVQPGEKVGFDAPLLQLVDLSTLEVQAQASLADIAKIKPGMPASVQIEGLAERSFPGRVERINPAAEPGTRSINVYVSLANEGSLLKAGMFARVRLTTAAERGP